MKALQKVIALAGVFIAAAAANAAGSVNQIGFQSGSGVSASADNYDTCNYMSMNVSIFQNDAKQVGNTNPGSGQNNSAAIYIYRSNVCTNQYFYIYGYASIGAQVETTGGQRYGQKISVKADADIDVSGYKSDGYNFEGISERGHLNFNGGGVITKSSQSSNRDESPFGTRTLIFTNSKDGDEGPLTVGQWTISSTSLGVFQPTNISGTVNISKTKTHSLGFNKPAP